ncbi:hypothetical protein [Bradyrhizobium embrapense]
MVSPKPLSDLVPVVALIAFPIPAGPDAHAVAERSLHAKRSPPREENGLDSDLEGKFRPEPGIRVSLDTLRRFRRLFARAQSIAASKLRNSLKYQRFFSFLKFSGKFRRHPIMWREQPPKL